MEVGRLAVVDRLHSKDCGYTDSLQESRALQHRSAGIGVWGVLGEIFISLPGHIKIPRPRTSLELYREVIASKRNKQKIRHGVLT